MKNGLKQYPANLLYWGAGVQVGARAGGGAITETLTLQPGWGGMDTYVNSSSADTDYDGSSTLGVRATLRAALLKFDLTRIPPVATILSATLTLTNTAQISVDMPCTVSAVLAANSAWTIENATWNHARASATRWAGDTAGNGGADAGCSQSGTDYSATPLGTFTYTANAPVGTAFACALDIAQVQAWLTLANNHGLLVTTSVGANLTFAASDNATAAYRPKLEITYSTPAYTPRYFAGLGDSKTAAHRYQMTLRSLLYGSTGQQWAEIEDLSISGYTAALWATGIDAALAGITAVPEFILYNLGANEADDATLPTETAWKDNVRYIWRAIHTKWSSCPIYVARIWRQGQDADCATLNGYLDDLIAEEEFETYVYAGPDESIFLKGDDDGASNTNDGLHPNTEGYALTATQWHSALGY